MAEAFFGYLLPWGQMSFWGAQVIVNLFAAIPFIGPDLAVWIRGDFVVGDATLNRFFAFHVIAIPFVIAGLVAAHIIALHEVGSNNPDGVDIKKEKDAKGIPVDGIPFHPYYTIHDIYGLSIFLIVFAAVVFFAPELGGYFLEYNNFIPADPLVTPSHIAPVWYFTPYYSMLRAVTDVFTWALVAGSGAFAVMILFSKLNKTFKFGGLVVAIGLALTFRIFDAKFWGVAVMGGAVLILFLLPWLDKSPVKSIRYRPGWHKILYGIFVVNFFVLGYLGVQPPTFWGTIIAQAGTVYYFLFFILMPFWTPVGSFGTVPARVQYQPH
jgi:ubiquinol-cytochrome c reductase cytochrome b subunit